MFFHKNKRSGDSVPEIMLEGKQLNFTRSITYLGFILDDKLTFKSHISYIAVKLRKWVGLFWKLGPHLTVQAKSIVFSSLFQSNILYGLVVYGNAAITDIKPLQTLQNKALKALYKLPRLHPSKDLEKQFCVLKINELFNIRASLLLWLLKHILRA
jgi:hypothetical protein